MIRIDQAVHPVKPATIATEELEHSEQLKVEQREHELPRKIWMP